MEDLKITDDTIPFGPLEFVKSENDKKVEWPLIALSVVSCVVGIVITWYYISKE